MRRYDKLKLIGHQIESLQIRKRGWLVLQRRAAVESEFAFRGTGKHVSSDAGRTGERINLDLLKRLDSGRGEKFGTYVCGSRKIGPSDVRK